MNVRLLCKLLSLIAVLIGGVMVFSIPWAWLAPGTQWQHERGGVLGLLLAIIVCFATAGGLRYLGRECRKHLFRKEAMAVVGLSWVLATVLGALPFVLSRTEMEPGVPMGVVDAMFEAQSGFSTTGATVLTDLEVPTDPSVAPLVPRCILFWRSSTHFLGGLGIIVLFVVILGQGSAGKALMRAEMPGPSQSTPQARMQHTAWVLFLIYVGLNAALMLALWLQGLNLFDAICHAFGTMATGGFSTYNKSVGHFMTRPDLYNGALIEMTIVVFMVLAGTNFMLMYWVLIRRPKRMFADVEWRTYIAIILIVTATVVGIGLYCGDFGSFSGMTATAESKKEAGDPGAPVGTAVRFGLFQVVSLMTTTGFCTDNFDLYNGFGRGSLLLLMFIGGCAGSTGGGLKVIRHILFVKILRLEVEQAFHPTVVRPLRLGGEPIDDPQLGRGILVYFGLIAIIFAMSWLFMIATEPDSTWGEDAAEDKLIDSATCITATLNNIGPGLGVIGATRNYAQFHWYTKLLFIWLMMLGRLELFVILVLFVPAFWRTQ